MPVYYNSSGIIPAPFVSITKNYTKTNDGTIIGQIYNISLIGSLVRGRGGISPTNTDTTNDTVLASGELHLGDLLERQAALRNLFSQDGKVLEVQGFTGAPGLKFNTRVIDMTFQDGLWFNIVPYTITLEADEEHTASGTFAEFISSASESWDIVHNDNNTYSVSHNISAQGKLHYTPQGTSTAAWEEAKKWVNRKRGFNNLLTATSNNNWLGFGPSGINVATSGAYFNQASGYWIMPEQGPYTAPMTSTNFYNSVIQESVDSVNGAYSVNESWILSKEPAIDEYTVSVNFNYETGRTNVNIDGQITGLEVRNNEQQLLVPKWNGASGYFFNTLLQTDPTGPYPLYYGRALRNSYVSLNSGVISYLKGYNERNGAITYSFSFDDRPYPFISGALTETINVSDTRQNNVIAVIPIIGRAAGPILQRMNTSDPTTRSVDITCTMPTNVNSFSGLPTGSYDLFASSSKPNTDNIINFVKPSGFKSFKTSDVDSWNWITGQYQRTVQWTYEY